MAPVANSAVRSIGFFYLAPVDDFRGEVRHQTQARWSPNTLACKYCIGEVCGQDRRRQASLVVPMWTLDSFFLHFAQFSIVRSFVFLLT